MKYLLPILITLLIVGCGSNSKKKDINRQENIKQPLVPKVSNEKLQPPSIPNLEE